MKEYVKINIKDKIGYIEFFHPQSNSLPYYILSELAKTITHAGNDKSIKVIVLKSGGNRVFCSGASFDELTAIKNLSEGIKFFSGFAQVINAIRTCPKFIIGRVQGKSVGGGVGIACSTDYCFGTQFSSAKLSELDIGIGPFVVGPSVERKINKYAFSAMSINATKWFDANWCLNQGMYMEIYDTTEEMDKKIKSLCSKLTTYSPEAMSHLKKILWKGTEDWDKLLLERSKISGKLVLSKFTKDAITKFKQNNS